MLYIKKYIIFIKIENYDIMKTYIYIYIVIYVVMISKYIIK